MILRIQQFAASDAQRLSGWDGLGDAVGAIRCPLPAGTNALELSVLETDEQHRPVAIDQRRWHLRVLCSSVAQALREPADSLVVRLDGPIAAGELAAGFNHLTDAHGGGRFAISAAVKFDPSPAPTSAAAGGVRIELSSASAEALLGDASLGIDRGVRMRVFAVPPALVNPLLDIADLDDERWPDVLAAATFVMGNTHGLDALHVLTRLAADEVSQRVNGRLGGGGSAGGGGGGGAV